MTNRNIRHAALITICVIMFKLAETADHDYSQQSGQAYWKNSGSLEIEKALKARKALNEGIAKNVILFIGDGMGPNTITATRIFRDGESSSLSFEQFPHVGLLKTYAVDVTVPDSACTATALFSGVKANFETVGLDGGVKLTDCEASKNTTHHLSTIVNWAQKAGKSTGFVTTTRVTHATPSSLYAHSADRRWECDSLLPETGKSCQDIGRQLVENEPGKSLNVIMGGGRQTLRKPPGSKDSTEWSCVRGDGLDLIQAWKDEKTKKNVTWKYLENSGDLKALDKNTEYVMGLFANSHMLYEDERDTSEAGPPSLQEMTKAAIEVLSKNENGYVLMVEGGMIDQAHHRGQVRRALVEAVQFHEAVETALNATDSSDTLIIVTADHAHSLTINGLVGHRNNILGLTKPSKVDGVPFNLLSYMVGGPDNFPYSVENGKVVRQNPQELDTTKPDYIPQAGVLNDEVTHGGVDVPVFAIGPMAHLFHSVHEQTYVAHVIAYAARLEEYANLDNHSPTVTPAVAIVLFCVSALLFW